MTRNQPIRVHRPTILGRTCRSSVLALGMSSVLGASHAGAGWIDSATLLASDGIAEDRLGWLAADGDILVAGVTGADVGANSNQGAVYVFARPAGGWSGELVEIAKLTASDGEPSDNFGASVAIDGDTIVVGAPNEDTEGGDAGAGYLFIKPPGGWTDATETARLSTTALGPTDHFGTSVAVEGDVAVFGASGENSVFVFEKPLGGWATTAAATATLRTSEIFSGNLFGSSVAISGAVIAAGAGSRDSGAGSIYIFERAGAAWTPTTAHNAKLHASDRLTSDQLGFNNLDIDGDVVVAGIRTRTVAGKGNAGQAYIWNKPLAGWSGLLTEDATLIAPDGGSGDNFGTDVAIDGDVIVVGAGAADTIGAGYRFEKPVAGWTGQLSDGDRLDAADPTGVQSFGNSVALTAEAAFVSALQGDVGAVSNQGFAIAFTYSPCEPAPREDCAEGASGKGKLQLAQREGAPSKSAMKWKWVKGEEVLGADLGDPTDDTDYTLCLYDGSGETLTRVTIPAGGDCSGKPCWKAAGAGFKFKNKTGSNGGVAGFGIKPGASGKSKIGLKAKGASLEVPELPLVQSPAAVVVQLVNSASAACWSASFSAPARSDGGSEKWDDLSD